MNFLPETWRPMPWATGCISSHFVCYFSCYAACSCFLKLRLLQLLPFRFRVHLLIVLLQKYIFTYWLGRNFYCTSMGFLSIRLENNKERVSKGFCLAFHMSQITTPAPIPWLYSATGDIEHLLSIQSLPGEAPWISQLCLAEASPPSALKCCSLQLVGRALGAKFFESGHRVLLIKYIETLARSLGMKFERRPPRIFQLSSALTSWTGWN